MIFAAVPIFSSLNELYLLFFYVNSGFIVELILSGVNACCVPKNMLPVNLLILYNINQKGARGETDMYKKNIHIPVGHEKRFARGRIWNSY